MLVHEKTGKRRYKDTEENEVLHGFERGHTLPAYTSKERRLNPVGAVDARGRLLGNCYHPFAVAFLIGELAAELGLVREGVTIDELAQAHIRPVPTANASVLSNADQRADGHPHELGLQDMARYLLLQQSARGGEIRNLAGVPHRACKWSEVPAQWFQWSTALSVPWRQKAHINICEAMARHLSLRQWARQASLHHQCFLHLMDSQVCLNVASKGRPGSRRMSHVQRKSSLSQGSGDLAQSAGQGVPLSRDLRTAAPTAGGAAGAMTARASLPRPQRSHNTAAAQRLAWQGKSAAAKVQRAALREKRGSLRDRVIRVATGRRYADACREFFQMGAAYRTRHPLDPRGIRCIVLCMD